MTKREEWKDPGTIHDKMYKPGDIVSHNGKLWVSRHPFLNCWEPGTEGVDDRIWEEYTEPGAEPDKGDTPAGDTAQTPEKEPEPTPAAEDGSQAHPFNWEVGKTYTKGQFITVDGKVYKMAQTHTAVSHYRPGPGLESIYQPV